MPCLVEAYLDFHAHDFGDGFLVVESTEANEASGDRPSGSRSRDAGDGSPVEGSTEANEAPGVHPSGTVSNIELIDIFSEYNFVALECLLLTFV